MRRIAFISDVHADVDALSDALTQAERLGCERVVCAGDLVDYGAFPNETLELLRSRSIPCIRGNHDRWQLEKLGEELTPESMQFLAELPLAWDAVIEGVRVAVRHARPRSDMEGIYPGEVSPGEVRSWLDDVQADVLIVGHTHLPFTVAAVGGRGMIANPGALLRSAKSRAHLMYDPEKGRLEYGDAPPGGTFGVLELPAQHFRVYRAADGVELEIPRLTTGIRDSRAR